MYIYIYICVCVCVLCVGGVNYLSYPLAVFSLNIYAEKYTMMHTHTHTHTTHTHTHTHTHIYTHTYIYIYIYIYIYTNPSKRAGCVTRTSFMQFNRFEFRVFLLLDELPNQCKRTKSVLLFYPKLEGDQLFSYFSRNNYTKMYI